MKTIRIIPRLDIKGPNLVKGIHLEGFRVLGSPEKFAQYYYENGADEIIFQDVVASLFDRNSLHEIISRTAKNIFIPITVGGGIRSIEDIRDVLRAGADKVSLNTAAVRNPYFIEEAATTFGSSTIVIAIEAIKNEDGNYYAFVDNGREETGLEVTQWAERVANLGAGEILITSVDRDGTGEGFDAKLIADVKAKVNIPIIAHGGGNKRENLFQTIEKSKTDALAFASFLHYSAYKKVDQITNEKESGNRSFLDNNQIFNKIESGSIMDIKQILSSKNISCRV